jgi:osmotically-inducible protein OsmY
LKTSRQMQPTKKEDSMATTTQSRRDVDLQLDIQEELSWTAHVHPNEIGVTVKEGVVTLTGTVESYLIRQEAENTALHVRGVHAVANDIVVRLPLPAERTDSDLALAALNALKWDAAIPTDQLDVTVSNAWVTLRGQVDWHFQREVAQRVVQRLAGVKGVTDLITVAPQAVPADIKQRIERAYLRRAEVDAKTIAVSVHGHTATLKGTVRSYLEKVAAGRIAASAPGITKVENQSKVIYEE